MNKSLSCLITIAIAVFVFSCKNENQSKCDTSIIDSLLQVSNQQYNSHPEISLKNKLRLEDLYNCTEVDDKRMGALYLNIASIYGEKLDSPDSALLYIDKALQFHTKENDTLNIANILKYQGLFLAEQEQYWKALSVVDKSIELYDSKNNSSGMHVAYQNMAKVLIQVDELEAADSLLMKSLNYWKSKRNIQRQTFVVRDLMKVCERMISCDCILRIKSQLVEVNMNPQSELNQGMQEFMKKHCN